MNIDFPSILQGWLDEEGWTQAELARRTNRTTGAISLILNGQRKPSAELLKDIAEALMRPREVVFRAAGHLSPVSPSEEYKEELLYLFESLNLDEKREVLELMRFKAERKMHTSRMSPARNAFVEK